jgi:hypothetical protein
MKQILLFEAFTSNVFSKSLKFLEKEVDKSAKNKFLDEIKILINNYSLPIDKISDNDVDYMQKKDALKIKNNSDVNNIHNIYCIKYWFSKYDGYLGKTYVGNERCNYVTDVLHRRRKIFTTDDVNIIRNKFNLENGELLPISDYTELKTGDVCFLDINRLIVKAVIFRDSTNVYAIQDVNAGGEPNIKGWRDYGRYSWNIASRGGSEVATDHSKLHKYIDSDLPLYVKIEDLESKTYFNYNLPFYHNRLSTWIDSYTSPPVDTIENMSDFAIIVYVDNIINSNIGNVDNIRNKRIENRENTLKLMSDDNIRDINISKYISRIINDIGISKEKVDFIKINKLPLVCLSSYPIMGIIFNSSIDRIESIKSNIKSLIEKNSIDDNFENLLNKYKRYHNSSKILSKKMKNADVYINNNFDKENFGVKTFNVFLEINKELSKSVLSEKIESLDDIDILIAKLKSIDKILNDDDFSITNQFSYLLERIDGERDYYDKIEQITEKDYKKTINLLKYIKSIF